jgi:hypothetical protein
VRRGRWGVYLTLLAFALLLVGAVLASLYTSPTPSPRPVSWEEQNLSVTAPSDPNDQAAVADATQLLELVQVASRWKAVSTAPVGLAQPVSQEATPNLVDMALFWTTPGDAYDVDSWIREHPPSGSVGVVSSGSGYARTGLTFLALTFGYPQEPPRLQLRQLTMEIAPLPDGVVGIRADAQIVWYATRPQAEVLAIGEHSMTATVTERSTLTSNPHVVSSKTFTDHNTVTLLARKVDSLTLQIPGPRSCPADTGTRPKLQLIFTGPGVATVNVLDDPNGCWSVTYAVSGHDEPMLEDDGLFHEVDQLLSFHLPYVDGGAG